MDCGNMNKFEEKVCLVAGNLGKLKNDAFICGLGGEIAKNLLSEGAQVIVIDLENEVARRCVATIGGKIKSYDVDLIKVRTQEKQEYLDKEGNKKSVYVWTDNPALELIRKIVADYGKIDAIISNFDHFKEARIGNSTENIYEELKQNNLSPTFHIIAAIRDQLSLQRKQNGSFAKIVIITNIMGKSGMSRGSLYSAFKGSMIGLTKSLAREFARFANVNAVAHGPLAVGQLQGPNSKTKKEFAFTKTELTSEPLEISHIAPLASFLASDDAKAITGQIFNVDQGLWLKLES
jgi:3-oxoacyl-[acyl-carrier protein] reductase